MTVPVLHVVSAGAARGLVTALAPAFEAAHGLRIAGTFGAVGAMRERLAAGAPCDVLVLSAAMIDALASEDVVHPDSVAAVGAVHTAIAVPTTALRPDVHDAAALTRALARASAIFFPDPGRATAGMHFLRVLERLHLEAALAARLRPYPNGAEAMAALAAAGPDAIGCTQATEIRYTPGVSLVGPLPDELGLATLYKAAVPAASAQPALARDFIDALTGPDSAALRAAGGFEPAQGSSAQLTPAGG
jgi:molybdate transport system substrate-binding protein